MREIKFRAWGPNTKNMWEWTELGGTAMGPFFSHGEKIIMQYTGLKDKNGKEIYEGDILKNKGILYPVVWDQERFGFSIRGKDPIFLNTPAFSSAPQIKRSAEIIGNIYENPELIANP